ncbi:MAG: stage 0 sporulation family protein [Clostridiales bacterium]|jgi:cell fate regulator YaaT (PSP1 superfamily)|nr:stage 0 sporulation family protein [Clostridiales bacterium]
MPKVVGIKFRRSPKVYYFAAGAFGYEQDAGVIVETSRGVEYGYVAALPFDIAPEKVPQSLKPIMRLATSEDTAKIEGFEARRDETMRVCAELIEQCGLNMKLVDAEYAFDGGKLVVSFSADNRVDFRDLVRKMASAFRIRIELRQIGARDECRTLGGLGPCGRVCCCNDYLNDYAHVSIKMAKNQNLSLNPAKISGLCGRLMCCLEYENRHYAETNKRMPKIGSTVKTADGKEGTVIGLNQLKETVKLKVADRDSFAISDVKLADLNFRPKTVQKNEPDEAPDEPLDEELKALIE